MMREEGLSEDEIDQQMGFDFGVFFNYINYFSFLLFNNMKNEIYY